MRIVRVEIPLRGRAGIRAWAIVSGADVALARHRWYLHPGGYAHRHVAPRGSRSYLHREVLGLVAPDQHADHINGDRLDCRRENLRPATPSQNMQNRHYGYGSSASRGVRCRVRGGVERWSAYGSVNRRQIHLGVFDTEAEAAAVAAAWRASNMPYSTDTAA